MTYLGVIMLVSGSLGLFASLIGLASLRLDIKAVRRHGVLSLRWSFIVAAVSVLLAVLGLVIGGTRNISDSLGILMLAGSFVVIVVATLLLIASGMRSDASRTWAIIKMTMVALVVGGFMWFGAAWDDFTSSLILFVFGLPLLAAATGLLWLIVPLIRRRGRLNTVTFVWAAASLAAVGVVAITILTVSDRLVETSEGASLRATFPMASGWSPALLDIAFDYAQELHSTSVIVIRDGELVAEWGKTDKRTSAHSVRKSLLSALYGIGAEKGLIDIDSPSKHWASRTGIHRCPHRRSRRASSIF